MTASPVPTTIRSEEEAEQATRGRLAILAFIVAAAPFTLFFLNRDWLLTPESYLDPWHYVGFFHEYWNPGYSPGAYKLARLPWILSGVLFTQLLPGISAAYALHFTYLAALTLCMFVGVYRLFGRASLAAVVALLLGFYTPAHGSGGWDYHNTAAGAFYAATFMVLAGRGALEGRRRSLLTAGALAALAVHCNITFVNFLPALVFVYLRTIQLRVGPLPPLAGIAARAAWGIAGSLLITAALGLVNWLAGREFLFFGVLFNIVVRYVGDSNNVAGWRQTSAWYFALPHLGPLFGVFTASVVLVLFRWRRPSTQDRLAVALALQFIVMCLVWVGWQLAGQLALDWDYFAYVLIPSCIIAIAGLLAPRWPAACERHPIAVALGTAATLTLALGGGFETLLTTLDIGRYAAMLVPLSGAIFMVAFAVPYLRSNAATTAVFVVLFAFAMRTVTPAARLQYNPSDACPTQPGIYEAVVDASSWLSAQDPTNQSIRTWFEQQETTKVQGECSVGVGVMAGAISTMAFTPYVVNPFPMPGVNDIALQAIIDLADNDLRLAILTASEKNVQDWAARLASVGLQYEEVDRHRVKVIDSSFTIHLWAITLKPPDDVTFGNVSMHRTAAMPLQANFYGAPQGRLETSATGSRFIPTDMRDHAASPMTPLEPRLAESWARLTVRAAEGSSATCRISLQNQALETLASTSCGSTVKIFRLPPLTQGIRITLSDAARQPIVVPDLIEVALSQ